MLIDISITFCLCRSPLAGLAGGDFANDSGAAPVARTNTGGPPTQWFLDFAAALLACGWLGMGSPTVAPLPETRVSIGRGSDGHSPVPGLKCRHALRCVVAVEQVRSDAPQRHRPESRQQVDMQRDVPAHQRRWRRCLLLRQAPLVGSDSERLVPTHEPASITLENELSEGLSPLPSWSTE